MMLSRLALSSLLLILIGPSPKAAPAQEEWISIFNGKDLTGWTPKFSGHDLGDNYNDTFRVEDGVLKVSYAKYDKFSAKFGHIFYEKPFSHYRLRLEYRFVGDQVPQGPGWAFRNNGIMVHCQSPESMGKNQNFPVSIEVQLLGGKGTGNRTTGNLCTPGTNVVMNGKLETRHCINSTSETYHGDRWVKAEVEVRGAKTIKHIIEGKTVMTYSQPQLDDRDGNAKKLIKDGQKIIKSGWISLQAESHPCEFRNIEILMLDKD